MAWKILTVYYVDNGYQALSFLSDGRSVFPDNKDQRDSADLRIGSIYRIVYFGLPETRMPEPLLVLDVASASRLQYSGKTGIAISAWIYSPLILNVQPLTSTTTLVHWETELKGGARVAYSKIQFWDKFSLLELIPRPTAVADQLADALKSPWRNEDPQGIEPRPNAGTFPYSWGQRSGFPNFHRNVTQLSDLSDSHGLGMKLPRLPDTCGVPASAQTLWQTRAFFVRAKTILGEQSGPFFILVFRLTSPRPGDCLEPSDMTFRAFDPDVTMQFTADEFPAGWTLVHRPASTITAGPGNLDADPARASLNSVLHVFNLPGRSAARLWNQWAKDYYQALWSVSGGGLVSFLPTFRNAEGEQSRWVMSYLLAAYLSDTYLNAGGAAARRNGTNQFYAGAYADHWPAPAPPQPPPPSQAGVVIEPLSLHLQGPDLPGALEFPRVYDVFGDSLPALALNISSTAPSAADSLGKSLLEPELVYGLALKYLGAASLSGAPGQTPLVRMGSLDLALGGARTNNTDQDAINWLALRREQAMTRVHVDAKLMVSDVLPGGQDDPPGEEYVPDLSNSFGANPCTAPFPGTISENTQRDTEIERSFRRKRPLVIHLNTVPKNDGGYTLHIKEDVAPFETRAITLTVYSQKLNTAPPDDSDMCGRPGLRSALVLDRNPFLVAQVLYTPFEAPPSDRGSIIATWSNTNPQQSASWMLQFNQQPFCLVMPPQAVGEEMVKSKSDDRPDFPENKADSKVAALPFRFSGNARLTVDPRKQITSFSEAPWNLRRILGTPSDPLPGPMVSHMQYELLYGLSCDLSQPAFRLADLMARIGQIPGRRNQNTVWIPTAGQANAYNRARLDWARLYSRYLSRVALLEPWNGIVNSPTSSVSVKQGLSCVIREGPGVGLANPIAPEPDKLRGGVTWGFESRNIYDQVMSYRNRANKVAATAATLDSFSLSTLGGWGKQTAEFVKGLTKIYADVEMGRTSTYKLDRIGRIAAWWVTAKHVIVYQRSVIPSRQFYLEQPQYKGWPVPRKVEEFVEILEDARSYPDGAAITDAALLQAARQACGPIKSILLKKGMRFNVDSAWGSDVNLPEASGWKIPLWTPGAWPPDVYPKPAVGIGAVVADGTAGVKQAPVCDNPENLFFFTLTGIQKNGKLSPDVDPDPHVWPPVRDVDYVNAPTPEAPSDFDNVDLRQTVAAPSAVPAAFGPCTFRLRPGAAPSNLVADRASKQMAVVLETITVSRAVATGATDLSAAATTVQNVQKRAADVCTTLLRTLPRDASVKLNAEVWGDLQRAVITPAQNAKDQITNAANTVNALKAKIKSDAAQFEQSLRNNFSAALTKATADALADYRKSVADVTAFNAPQALAFLDAMQRNVEQAILFPSSTPGSLAQMVARFVDAAMAIKKTVELASADFNNALAQWSALGAKASRDLAAAVLQAQSIANSLKTLRRPLDSLPDIYAWAGKQLGAILTGIDAAAKSLTDTLNTAGGITLVQATAALKAFQATPFYLALAGELPVNVKALVVAALPAETINNIGDVYQKLYKVDYWIHGFPKDAVDNNGQLKAWADRCLTIRNTLTSLTNLQVSVGLLDSYVNTTLAGKVKDLITDVTNQATTVAVVFEKELDEMKDRLQASVDGLVQTLTDAALPTIDELRAEIEKQRDNLSQQAEVYLDKTFRQLTDTTVYQTADTAFRVIHALGAPPQVPNLGFDRDKVAYYFKQVAPQVDLTPVLARVSQAAQAFDTIKSLGAAIPALGALEQLVPKSLEGFGLSDIFPNFAGLDLSNLFSGIKLPSLGSDAVKITHDFDPQTLRATVNADIKFPIAGASTLFTIGPVAVQILKANFSANASLAADKTGIVRRTASGTIFGDWQLSLAGTPFVNLTKTSLSFDDSGAIKFSVKPQNVTLPGALEVVTGLLNKFVSPDSGLTFGMLNDGFQAILALPVPNIQGLTSGFSNLKLGALFTVEIAESFTMGVGFSLASKAAPFSLTIFVLGGGGYVSAKALYTPGANKLGCQVDMAITASASLAISLTVISGGVYVYFGATASYNTNGQGLTFGVMFLIRGEVSILGIVSAAISLLLEATYSAGTLTGRGTLSIKIQICWCFTLEVNESVSYTLGKQDSNVGALRPPGPLLAALEPGPFGVVSDADQNPAAGAMADAFDVRAAEYVAILV